MAESKILTEALAKVDAMFDLRQTLENYGVPCTEPLKIIIKSGRKEYECKEFPALKTAMKPQLIQKNLKETIIDLMNKADALDNIYEKLELNKDGEKIEVALKYGDNFNNTIALAGGICCPCPWRPGCCAC